MKEITLLSENKRTEFNFLCIRAQTLLLYKYILRQAHINIFEIQESQPPEGMGHWVILLLRITRNKGIIIIIITQII